MRFYIDTSDQETFVRDETGFAFADLEAAKQAAIDGLPDMARERLPDGDARTFLAIVRDAEGRSLVRASLTLEVVSLLRTEPC